MLLLPLSCIVTCHQQDILLYYNRNFLPITSSMANSINRRITALQRRVAPWIQKLQPLLHPVASKAVAAAKIGKWKRKETTSTLAILATHLCESHHPHRQLLLPLRQVRLPLPLFLMPRVQ